MTSSPSLTLVALAMIAVATNASAGAPFNPYDDGNAAQPPVSADGTIHWGTFYKSAAIQKSYERLWNLGACRNTNKAITIPVAENKLVIDRLPEAEFKGVVTASAGGLAGGMVAFVREGESPTEADPLVAQFHPAGVTRFAIQGRAPAAILAPGMVVRFRAEADSRGRIAEPVRALDVVTPPKGFKPDEVRPNRVDTIVGSVVSIRKGTVIVRVDAGRLRKFTLTLADDAELTIDAAQFDLVGPGDVIEVKGRLWTGEGSAGAGTVFVSDVLVTKQPPAAGQAIVAPGPRTVGAR
jgi:hypothetical protein